MPRIVTVGSVALDNIRTPFGEVRDALGGAATFASFAASFFSDVGLVAVIGEDFPEEHLELLRNRNICLKGLKREGKTFRWEGYYEGDMNSAITTRTELNSFRDFNPVLPQEYRKAEYLFLLWHWTP
jgi:sugar/nucleoside kinase (ribokinase family)